MKGSSEGGGGVGGNIPKVNLCVVCMVCGCVVYTIDGDTEAGVGS